MRYCRGFAAALTVALGIASHQVAFADFTQTHICDVPSNDFVTIQSAVDEPLCATIQLAATDFYEQVTVNRSMTIAGRSFVFGEETFVSRLLPPPDMVAPFVLIAVGGPRTRVKIKHVIIEGPATGEGLIGVRAPRDTRVTVRDCVFRNLQPPTPDAREGFVGVHVGGPLVPGQKVGITGHEITNCRFEGYQNAAVVVEGSGTTATITENLMIGAGIPGAVRPSTAAPPTGILVVDGAKASIDRNNLVDNSRDGGGGAAIIFRGGAIASQVSYNNIDRNDLGLGIDGTDRAKIFRNGFTANDVGVALGISSPASTHVLQLNRIEQGGIGVSLGAGTATNLSSNDVLNHTSHGVVVSSASSKIVLYKTRAQNNGGFGFFDSSVGKGTAKTANTYTSNLCSGNNHGGPQSSPLGLCK